MGNFLRSDVALYDEQGRWRWGRGGGLLLVMVVFLFALVASGAIVVVGILLLIAIRSGQLPSWILLAFAGGVVLVAFAMWALKRDLLDAKRNVRNVCPQCGYDWWATRRRCPECGHGHVSRVEK